MEIQLLKYLIVGQTTLTLMSQNIKRNTSSLLRKMINFGLKKVKELLGSRNTQKLKM